VILLVQKHVCGHSEKENRFVLPGN